MPRYKVAETRARRAEYLIDAESEEAARSLDGDIVAEGGDADDYGLEILSVEQVDDDEEMI